MDIVKDRQKGFEDDLARIRECSRVDSDPASRRARLLELLTCLSDEDVEDVDAIFNKHFNVKKKESDFFYSKMLVEDNFRNRTRNRGSASVLILRRIQELEEIYSVYSQQHLKAVDANEFYKSKELSRVMGEIRSTLTSLDLDFKDLFEYNIDLSAGAVYTGSGEDTVIKDNFKTKFEQHTHCCQDGV